ncbi:MAG: ParA family protein [Candidatus Methanofastidiosia archaeon]
MRAKVISLVNQKGGVGKTTTAVSIASGLSILGKKTLLVDNDAQANTTINLGFDPENLSKSLADCYLNSNSSVREILLETKIPNLHLIPSDITLSEVQLSLISQIGREKFLKDILEEVLGEYEYVIIDTAPSLELLSINALVASNHVIIPIQTQFLALKGTKILLDTIKKIEDAFEHEIEILGILPTMYDPRTNISKSSVEILKKRFGELVFKNYIPRDVRLEENSALGETIWEYAPRCRAAKAYKEVLMELLEREKGKA